MHQIFDNIIAGLVHVGVDPVGRHVPGPPGKADADIAADLPYPDALPAEAQRGGPEPQVQPFVDRAADPLQREVLAAAEKEQPADRASSGTQPPSEMPETSSSRSARLITSVSSQREPNAAEHRGEVSHDNQVDRVARSLAAAVRRGLRRRGQVLAEAGDVDFGQVADRVNGIELAPQVVACEALAPERELEVLRAVRPEQADQDHLVSFRQVGEHEPRLLSARRNRTHAEGVFEEERVHLPVCAADGQQL